jgi:acetolactate synthase I/II/III large subunit
VEHVVGIPGCMIRENGQHGSIVWKREKRFGRHVGTEFGNRDVVRLAEAFGIPARRIGAPDELGERLHHALTLDTPSMIVVPTDYSLDVAIVEELGTEIVRT